MLTINGTPATTPSSDGQRSLGQSSDTPASTPTELHDLLPQQSRATDASPYQEIQLNGNSRVPAVVHSSADHHSATFGREPSVPLEAPPPLPEHPPPVYVPNQPRVTVSARSSHGADSWLFLSNAVHSNTSTISHARRGSKYFWFQVCRPFTKYFVLLGETESPIQCRECNSLTMYSDSFAFTQPQYMHYVGI